MSGVKPITSYFKVLTKDQLELSELLDTQSSRNYRTLSLQTAITNSTLSTKGIKAQTELHSDRHFVQCDPKIKTDDLMMLTQGLVLGTFFFCPRY